MTEHTTPTDDTVETSDADLVLRARSGDSHAYGELWQRHYRSGIVVARSVSSDLDPDDLVQEAFTKIFQAVRRGGGPTGSFRAYLFTSIRNTAAGWGRARREHAIDVLDTVADPESTESAADEALDRSLTAQAFRSLPSRWQEVLWYSEIEQMKPAAIAPLLGMSSGAVSQLAFRAREGLREAWIQAHLRAAQPGSDCQWTIERLGAYSRGNLGTRDLSKLENHVEDCARCLIVAAEAKDVSDRIALVLLPLVLGVAGASAYLSALQGGGTSLVALAAMPSNVIEGAVAAGTAVGAGVAAGSASSTTGVSGLGASGTGASGATASGVGGTAAAASSSGAIGSLGAIVGLASTALVVSGAIVAAAIVPGWVGDAGNNGELSAAHFSAPSIVAEVTPPAVDHVVTPAPVVEDTPPPVESPPSAPTPEPTRSSEPGGANSVPVPLPPVEPPLPVQPPAPSPEPTPDPSVTPEPTPSPTLEPTPSPEPTSSPVPTPDPTPEVPAPDPTPDVPAPGLPRGRPDAGQATLTCEYVTDGSYRAMLRYDIPVSGVPGAQVQVLLDGEPTDDEILTLDSEGVGLLEVRPSLLQIALNARLNLRYYTENQTGPTTATVRLWDLVDPDDISHCPWQ